MDTATPPFLLALAVLAMAGLATSYQQFAQDCRIYQLRTQTPQYKSPTITFSSPLTLSFYNEDIGDMPRNIHIILQEKTGKVTRKEKIHINPDGVLFLDHAKPNNLTFSPSCYPHSWLSLAIMLQDQNIIIYDINNRMNYITASTLLGSNATAEVTTSQRSLYVTANCPAGCLMHDHTSPLIGLQMQLARYANIYLSHEEGATSASISIGFTDYQGKNSTVTHDITDFESSLWHKLVIAHDAQDHIIVRANGIEKSKVMISEENSTFTILSSSSVLWSLDCHPEHATDLKGWVIQNTTEEKSQDEDKDEEGAGAAEVAAWVLAGMALFVVMIMALFICTKKGPKSEITDYGASVGVVTSYGRTMTYRNEREAEEDTEPDSPTFLSPVIQHKVPEEEDEEQSNTKML
ncbi:uncharacterized protein [Palaemon carinicauda]|uniref:uncharacterized protein isoform X2 n=1 Tax=Palaemon carinicauda TaxID=392227 RepID=UPI0035B5D409